MAECLQEVRLFSHNGPVWLYKPWIYEEKSFEPTLGLGEVPGRLDTWTQILHQVKMFLPHTNSGLWIILCPL